MRQVQIPRRVRRADQPVRALPRDDEQHAAARSGDESGRGVDAVVGHDEVDPLGCGHAQPAGARSQALHLINEHAGRVDDVPRPHGELLAALKIAHRGSHDSTVRAGQPDSPDAGGRDSAVLHGGARHEQGVPGIVELAVVVLDCADQGVGAQRGHGLERPAPTQVPVPLHRAAATAAQHVVDRDAGADVEPFPDACGQRGTGTAPGGARGGQSRSSRSARSRRASRTSARLNCSR